ncbi:MAG: tRNA pseudouridine(13) synthase TruD [Planctomycetes bacterium]|nr:tRNA pseudouridine(13) synthase TruD [Planctomycetota bacterium]
METSPDTTPLEILAGTSLPWLTTSLPGIAGICKSCAEDFRVEEIPAYPAEERGDFLFLWVEKRELSSEQLVSHLAKCLKIAHQDVGLAGMKDRMAVTRQWVSVPVTSRALVETFSHPQIQILETHQHPHKLRTGHLKGNRFSLLIRSPDPEALPRAQAILEAIQQTGVPNFFGDQRFGRDSETLKLGLDLLCGAKTPGSIPRARRKFLLRLALSSVQSALFNKALTERIADGLVHRVLEGDVMQVVASGGPFVVTDVAREQARFDTREIVISGPIFGPKMKAPAGDVAFRESRLLQSCGMTPDAFEKFANLTPGTRRPYLIWPEDLRLSAEPEGLRLEFTLSAGSYATIVLREFQKMPNA